VTPGRANAWWRRLGHVLLAIRSVRIYRCDGCRFPNIMAGAHSSTCMFVEFSPKRRERSSHLRGGSENRTVVPHVEFVFHASHHTVGRDLGQHAALHRSSMARTASAMKWAMGWSDDPTRSALPAMIACANRLCDWAFAAMASMRCAGVSI
jgi:hypothetical protein